MEKYSFSKVRCFESCPLSYYKRYFEKPDNPLNHGTSEFGSFMHYLLEEYAKGNMSTEEMLPYYIEHFDENVVSSFTLKLSEDFTRNFYESYFKSGKEYLEDFDGFDDFEVLEVEYEFEEVVNNSFIFNGKIDLIVKYKNGDFGIIDHKSKASFKNKAELKEYAMQLYLYAYAVQKKYGKLPKVLMFNRFRKKSWDIIEFKQEDYEAALDWLINKVKEINECFDFSAVTGTFFCDNFCGYRDTCEEKGDN